MVTNTELQRVGLSGWRTGLAVHTLRYLAFTLMMGVLTAKRGVLLGVPLLSVKRLAADETDEGLPNGAS